MSPFELISFIKAYGIPVDQAIQEFGQWVHFGINTDEYVWRNQFLTAKKIHGKTQYLVGIYE